MVADRNWNKRLTIAFAMIVFVVLMGIVIFRQITSADDSTDVDLNGEIVTEIAISTPVDIKWRYRRSTIDIECIDYADKTYTETVTVKCRQHSIEINAVDFDTLRIRFEQRLPNYVLMWFNDTTLSTVHDYEMSAEDITCMILTQQVNYIKELMTDTTYTFCIFENTSTSVSPFDCIAYYLPPIDHEYGHGKSPVWISHDVKTPVILIGIGTFVIFLWLGIILGVWLVRRYPNWLKGSKNLVIVDSSEKTKTNCNASRRSDEFSVEDNNVNEFRRCMDRRRFSTPNVKDYEIALNPSRFDIIKSRLEATQYEEKCYLEDVPRIAPPVPPKSVSPAPSKYASFVSAEENVKTTFECKRHSDVDLNLDTAVYSKCNKIKN